MKVEGVKIVKDLKKRRRRWKVCSTIDAAALEEGGEEKREKK